MSGLQIVEHSSGPGVAYAGSLFVASGLGTVRKFQDHREVGYGRASLSDVLSFLDRTKSVTPYSPSDLEAAIQSADVFLTDDQRVLKTMVPLLAQHAIAGVVTLSGHQSSAVSDLLAGAELGLMATTGYPDREPLFGVGNRVVQYAAGLHLFIGVLLAHLQDPARRPPHIEVDLQAVSFCLADQYIASASYSGIIPTRAGRATGPNQPHGVYRCRDGYVTIFITSEGEWRRFANASAHVLLYDPHFSTDADRAANYELLAEHIVRWAAAFSRHELLELGTRQGFSCMPIFSIDEAMSFLGTQGVNPSWQNHCLPPPMNTTLNVEQSDVPQHRPSSPTNQSVSSPTRRWKGADNPATTSTGLPLAGLRVVEVTTAWAGPLVGRILAAAGAQVIKVESDTKWDVWRGPREVSNGFNRYPDQKAPSDGRDSNGVFNTENRGKIDAVVNLKDPEGQALFRRLITQSDVLVENLRPGTFEKLGLSFDELVGINPQLLMVSISAVGQSPDIVGWGSTIESLSGMSSLVGYPDNERPLNSGIPIVDPLTGLWATSLLLSALSGNEGPRHIKTSMVESVLACFMEPAISPPWTDRLGNTYPGAALHGCYRTTGSDEWIVIACDTGQHVVGLLRELGLELSPTADQSDIRQAVSNTVARRDGRILEADLRRAGVPAAVVKTFDELFHDPNIRARGALVEIEHPMAGMRWYTELPLRFGTAPPSRSPMLGEHNALVWREIVGLDEPEYQALIDRNVIN